MLKTRV